jgi:hypothetical protein
MNSESSLAAMKGRIAGQMVGRDDELELVLAAVDAGRVIVLEGPPGTSRTTKLTSGVRVRAPARPSGQRRTSSAAAVKSSCAGSRAAWLRMPVRSIWTPRLKSAAAVERRATWESAATWG